MPDRAGSADGRTDDRDQLVRALVILTPRQRRMIALRHLLDLSEAEVAAELGISVGTVKSTASRALATLRTDMAGDGRRSQTRPGGSDDRTD